MGTTIRNTAPQREQRVTAQHFKALKGSLTLEFNHYSSGGNVPRDAVKAWNKHVPVSPKTAYEMLTRELPEGTKVMFRALDPDGTGRVSIEKENDDEDSYGDAFSNSRDFNLAEHTVDTGSVTVANKKQGGGIGRRTMRNQIEFFHACGVKEFEIYASSSNGGYTWARLGFLPKELDARFKSAIGSDVRSHLKDLRPVLNRKIVEHLEDSLRFRRRTDLWRIADTDVDLVPLLAPVFNDSARSGLTGKQKTELRDKYEDDYNEAVKAGRPLPLGRVLLTGTSWDGILNLDNAKQMKRVGKYCGGWKYIEMPG